MEKDFSQQEQKQLIDMYRDNKNIEDIMSILHSDEHCIRVILKQNKVDRNYNCWSEELYDRCIKLYSSGKTMSEIAYDLLISENGLGKILKKRKVRKRTCSECNMKYKRNSEYFDNINTPNKAYVLGMIYADGNIFLKGNKYCLTISLQEEDKDVLDRIRQELEYEGPIRLNELSDKNPNYKNQYILAINDEHICNQLKMLGIVERKSLTLTFPNFLRPDLYRHFLRGYFDGDGCIYYDNKRNKCRTSMAGTSEFCLGVSNMLLAFNVKHNIYHPKQCLDHNTNVLQTAANASSYKFLSWLYQDCDIKMNRKYNKYLLFCEKYTNPKGRIKSL